MIQYFVKHIEMCLMVNLDVSLEKGPQEACRLQTSFAWVAWMGCPEDAGNSFSLLSKHRTSAVDKSVVPMPLQLLLSYKVAEMWLQEGVIASLCRTHDACRHLKGQRCSMFRFPWGLHSSVLALNRSLAATRPALLTNDRSG